MRTFIELSDHITFLEKKIVDTNYFLSNIKDDLKRGLEKIRKKKDFYDGLRETSTRKIVIDKYWFYEELYEIGIEIVKKIDEI